MIEEHADCCRYSLDENPTNQDRYELGDNHHIHYWVYQESEIRAGFTMCHRKPTGELCYGAVTFDMEITRTKEPDRQKWQVDCLDPLTISPSVACACGDHGFIRNGTWIKA